MVKAPPFLLGATLLFWGWQTGFLAVGASLAAVVESARFVRIRWDVSDEDFYRIWNFSTLLTLAAAIFVFTTQEGGGLLHGSAVAVGSKAALSGGRTATTLLRWLPVLVFPVVVAQVFSEAGSIPLTAISIILRRRRQREQKQGRAVPPSRRTDVGYAFFILCLFSASVHTNLGQTSFFWGQCFLLAWALWPFRSRRYGITLWIATLVVAVAAGYWGQTGLGRLEQMVEGYNAQFLMRLLRSRTDPMQSVTALGQIGRLKLSSAIVIRLRPKLGEAPPTYLHEASYRKYGRQRWDVGPAGNELDTILSETNTTTWILLPGKTNVATVNIACYLNGKVKESDNPAGLLPLPIGCGRIENLGAYVMQKNRTGAVLVEGPGLVIFDANYGPGATLDSPPETNVDLTVLTNVDLSVPTNELPALDQVIAEMNAKGLDESRTRQAIQGFFQDKFIYSTWLGREDVTGTNETALGHFLIKHRAGHCEYFATATVLLLRRLEIPARYAVGYAVHENAGKGYVVRERDAHAWCLVWNKQKETWEDFDTTPASWIAEEGERDTAWQKFSDFWSWVGFEIAKFRWSQTEWRRYFLWALIPVLLLLLYQILFRRGRKRQRPKRTGADEVLMSWPGLDSEFYLLEQRLAGRGVARHPSESLSDWLARALDDPSLKDLRAPLQKLLQLHYRYRFDPQGLTGPERETLKVEARDCLVALAQTKPGSN
jgi:hypothetical protein